MLWFFSKGMAQLRILTSLDEPTGAYLVEIQWPDRAPETHRFADESGCSAFLAAFEAELGADEWAPSGVRLAERPPISH
ncbi:MAG TPA: hypothetical protein VGI12_15050 [Vicinamibacterales bacterium]|jgi:hypothetical protein